jgi:sulfur-oxidizing protein SoxZ
VTPATDPSFGTVNGIPSTPSEQRYGMATEEKSKPWFIARLKGGVTEIKALIIHPMETGLRKDEKTGKAIPPRYIQEVVCTWKGKEVMSALWSGRVSQDPYLVIKIMGPAKGDTLTLTWTDNTGESDTLTTQIK